MFSLTPGPILYNCCSDSNSHARPSHPLHSPPTSSSGVPDCDSLSKSLEISGEIRPHRRMRSFYIDDVERQRISEQLRYPWLCLSPTQSRTELRGRDEILLASERTHITSKSTHESQSRFLATRVLTQSMTSDFYHRDWLRSATSLTYLSRPFQLGLPL